MLREVVSCEKGSVVSDLGRWGATEQKVVFYFSSRPDETLQFHVEGRSLTLTRADRSNLVMDYNFPPVEGDDRAAALFGRWKEVEHNCTFTLCFREDGSAGEGSFDFAVSGLPWRASSDYLTIRNRPFAPETWQYRVRGDRLVLREPDGSEVELQHHPGACDGDWFTGED